jgi:hypothetical protein
VAQKSMATAYDAGTNFFDNAGGDAEVVYRPR